MSSGKHGDRTVHQLFTNLSSSAYLTNTHYPRTIWNILLGSVCSLLGPHLDGKLKPSGFLPVQSSPSVLITALFELAAAWRKRNSHCGVPLKAGRGLLGRGGIEEVVNSTAVLCGCSQLPMGELVVEWCQAEV